MGIVKIIGIIAILIFLVAYIGDRTITWFVKPGSILVKVVEILDYVATGTFYLASACGIIYLFA